MVSPPPLTEIVRRQRRTRWLCIMAVAFKIAAITVWNIAFYASPWSSYTFSDAAIAFEFDASLSPTSHCLRLFLGSYSSSSCKNFEDVAAVLDTELVSLPIVTSMEAMEVRGHAVLAWMIASVLVVPLLLLLLRGICLAGDGRRRRRGGQRRLRLPRGGATLSRPLLGGKAASPSSSSSFKGSSMAPGSAINHVWSSTATFGTAQWYAEERQAEREAWRARRAVSMRKQHPLRLASFRFFLFFLSSLGAAVTAGLAVGVWRDDVESDLTQWGSFCALLTITMSEPFRSDIVALCSAIPEEEHAFSEASGVHTAMVAVGLFSAAAFFAFLADLSALGAARRIRRLRAFLRVQRRLRRRGTYGAGTTADGDRRDDKEDDEDDNEGDKDYDDDFVDEEEVEGQREDEEKEGKDGGRGDGRRGRSSAPPLSDESEAERDDAIFDAYMGVIPLPGTGRAAYVADLWGAAENASVVAPPPPSLPSPSFLPPPSHPSPSSVSSLPPSANFGRAPAAAVFPPVPVAAYAGVPSTHYGVGSGSGSGVSSGVSSGSVRPGSPSGLPPMGMAVAVPPPLYTSAPAGRGAGSSINRPFV